MSKSLRSMTDNEKRLAVDRRLNEKKGGLGFWSAVDAGRNDSSDKYQFAKEMRKRHGKK